MKPQTIAAMMLVPAVLGAQASRLAYPETREGNQVDDYFGTEVADPYRWLEDDNSPETAAWVAAQNEVTFGYLAAIPEREAIRQRLTTLWDFERYGVPVKEGRYYIYSRNDGLQNQAVIYKSPSLDASADVLLDPNALSPDGTVALSQVVFTEDGLQMAYSLSTSGSDWQEWHVRDVEQDRDHPDVLRWSKFSVAAWKKDGSGFFYLWAVRRSGRGRGAPGRQQGSETLLP